PQVEDVDAQLAETGELAEDIGIVRVQKRADAQVRPGWNALERPAVERRAVVSVEADVKQRAKPGAQAVDPREQRGRVGALVELDDDRLPGPPPPPPPPERR